MYFLPFIKFIGSIFFSDAFLRFSSASDPATDEVLEVLSGYAYNYYVFKHFNNDDDNLVRKPRAANHLLFRFIYDTLLTPSKY